MKLQQMQQHYELPQGSHVDRNDAVLQTRFTLTRSADTRCQSEWLVHHETKLANIC